MRRRLSLIVILLTILATLPVRTYSIPAFARKYQISCQVCHAPAMPRLKTFGDDFAKNGFRLTDYESPRYYIPAGDDRLSLFRELPLAIRVDGFASFNFRNDKAVDFKAPFVMKILSGGEISDRISYYFYFLLNETGKVAGVEDAFLMYSNLFRTGIDIYIGQFQASDPLFKSELRYTLEPYRIYDAMPGNSSANLKYDRGIMLSKAFSTGTTVVFELLNGYGLSEAVEDLQFDKDKYKNVMLRINQAAGPVGIGFFGYLGKEVVQSGPPLITNSIQMVGPDFSINLDDRFVFNLQYLFREDSDVFSLLGVRRNVTTRGGFVELIFSPKGDMSTWYLTGLINLVDSELDELDYSSATIHGGYLIRRNVRLVGEYTHQLTGEKYGRLSAGFVTAF
ncbi:MAG TPA: hypothetical protein VHO46_03235 [Bacteroidales bacterium]|nr:hypothetical protein [Bacteroidales bacterium]